MSAVPVTVEAGRETRWDEPLAEAIGVWLRARLAPGAALVADSRAVRPGDAFLAWPGRRHDGRSWIADALARGAAAVLHEPGDGVAVPLGVATLPVPALETLAGGIAAAFHGHPAASLRVVAVTGTNGKTSVSQWVARGLATTGRPSAVIGTLGAALQVDARPLALEGATLTTPDALSMQRVLADFVSRGARSVALEASSIGLDQGRLNGTPIEVAAFTNLARDHLDYHGSMADYEQAKAQLFRWPGLRAAVINGDDPASVAMLAALDAVPRPWPVMRILYGQTPGAHGARGDRVLMAERIVEDANGIAFILAGDFGRAELRLGLLGRFNVANALAVAGCWLGLGMSFADVVARLSAIEPVDGRMQRLGHRGGPLAVIDYAHTPDALASALESLRPVAMARGGALWCLFGAGGERDAGKRPLMGWVAEQGADRLVITSDNPRGEEPFRIVSDLRAGLSREPFLTELDRASAIAQALAAAGPNDVVLIAGKGHERTQEIRGQRLAFSDLAHARAALDARAREQTGSQPADIAAGISDV